jgi:hypothetical protein
MALTNKEIKIGDIVETCSLMPGIVMNIIKDDIFVRMLDVDEYSGQGYANCSLSHCGIVKLTSDEAIKRLIIGKEFLSVMWKQSSSYEDYIARLNNLFADLFK